MIKKILPVLIVLALFSCCTKNTVTQSPANPQQNTNNFVEDEVDVFFGPSQNGHPAFTNLVSMATKNINLVMFRITETTDSEALITAAKIKGVKIRVILDRESTLANIKIQKIKDQMIEAGIEVKLSTLGFTITHEKAFTIDDTTAVISTLNLTTGFKTTRDIGIVTKNQSIVNEFNSVFEADWVNADNNLAQTPVLSVDQLIWSPISSNAKLNALIAESQKSIELYVENFTDKKMADSLIQAAKNGVAVRVIVPLCSINPNPLLNVPVLKNLLANKVQVKVMLNPATATNPYIHAKSIVTDRKKSYVGSINFSNNSLNKAREVGIIFLNTKASEKISDVFNIDWSNMKDLPANPTLSFCGLK